MNLTVNGELRTVPEETTVAGLVALCALTPERVAVEVNEELVRRAQHGARVLREGDRVEIVTLVGGG